MYQHGETLFIAIATRLRESQTPLHFRAEETTEYCSSDQDDPPTNIIIIKLNPHNARDGVAEVGLVVHGVLSEEESREIMKYEPASTFVGRHVRFEGNHLMIATAQTMHLFDLRHGPCAPHKTLPHFDGKTPLTCMGPAFVYILEGEIRLTTAHSLLRKKGAETKEESVTLSEIPSNKERVI